VGQHTDLSAMVGFVSKHVAQHFHADRPGPAPSIAAKLLDAARATERFRQHFGAASRAFGQRRAGLARRAVAASKLSRNFQMRRGEANPLAANVMHMREDCRDAAGLIPAGQLRLPRRWGQTLDQHLVDAVVEQEDTGGRDLKRGWAGFRVGLRWTRGRNPSLAMKYGVMNEQRDKNHYTEQNNYENNCQRPENPRPRLPFPDLLYDVVQRESRSDCSERSKSKGRHKSIELRPSASMLPTVHRGQQNRKDVNACDEIRNCEA